MADEQTETETSGNGVSKSGDVAKSAALAAYLAGNLSDDSDEAVVADKKPAKPAAREVEDDDSDLEDDKGGDSDDDDEAEEVNADDSDDEDSDLDEDEDKPEDDEDDKDVDADTAKRLSQVRRTDKRTREKRERDFKAREAEVESKAKLRESQLYAEIERWRPRIDAAEKFERLKARAAADPIAVLDALDVPRDRHPHIAQVMFTMAKGKDDPKFREQAEKLIQDRALADEVEQLKKKDADRDAAEKDREARTASERAVEQYLDTVTKATSDKTPLAKRYIASNPEKARGKLAAIAFRLGQENGAEPSPRKVMIEFEKDRRRAARSLGFDPKTAAAREAVAADPKAKGAAPKKDDKKAVPKVAAKDDKPMTKDAFIRGVYD